MKHINLSLALSLFVIALLLDSCKKCSDNVCLDCKTAVLRISLYSPGDTIVLDRPLQTYWNINPNDYQQPGYTLKIDTAIYYGAYLYCYTSEDFQVMYDEAPGFYDQYCIKR